MHYSRSTDQKPYTKYRSDRFFEAGGKWYFYTREGTTEGPYGRRDAAQQGLENYLKVAVTGLYDDVLNLSLEPIKPS